MNTVREERNALIPGLRTLFHVWDDRVAEGVRNHGVDALVVQDAHRIAHTLAVLNEQSPPRRILEIGTGYLGMAAALRRRLPEACIAGVEYPGRRYIRMKDYQARIAAERIRLVAADIVRSGIPFRSQTFDLAVFAEVIEHLPPQTLPAVMTEIARTLVPGGWLLLTTPNLASWVNRELLLRGDSPGQQSPDLVIDGAYGHLRLYTMDELVRLAEGAGFRIFRRAFIDQIQLGNSRMRRLIRAMSVPVKAAWPALRDTCVLLARRQDG